MTVETARCKVVLVHRYFAPDTPPYANMLRSMARALAEVGHDVTVLTCQPSYNRSVVRAAPSRERVDGFAVVRWPVLDDRESHRRKALNLIWFSVRLLVARQFRGADLVLAATTPPVLVAKVCAWKARRTGAAFVYHKQDIWPEVAGTKHGRATGFALRVLRATDARTERDADRVVVLSTDMADTVAARGASARTEVLNNFDPWDLELDPGRDVRADGALDLVFAGNLGRFQGLEHVVALIRELADEPRLRWNFFGDGPLRTRLAALAAEGAPVTLHGFRPAAEVADFLRTRADLGVVSLNDGVIRSAYPSKTLTYLRNGCPLLVLVEQDTELARMVRDRQLGVTASQHDVAGSAARLRELLADPGALAGARARATATYFEEFAEGRQLGRWLALVADVMAERAAC